MENQPETHHGSSAAKNFFYYFLTFALLYTVAFNFGGILFDFINKYVPLVGDYPSGSFSGSLLRFHLASLIIASPVFLWLSRKVFREALKDNGVKMSAVRRWLTYITLIITTLIVVGDLISLVNNLLGGETTTRFILKSLVVLGIAVSILYYYLTDVKTMRVDAEQSKTGLPKIYFSASALLIVLVVIIGLFSIQSPATQRASKQDNVRVSYLVQIDNAIVSYASVRDALPSSLSDIQVMEGVTLDPVTKQPLEYRVVDAKKYELCASFDTSNKKSDSQDTMYYAPEWLHDSGRVCFLRALPDTQILNQKLPAAPAVPAN